MRNQKLHFRSKIVEFTYEYFPNIIDNLSSCHHLTSYDLSNNQNRYHIENGLWTHTLMVLQQACMDNDISHWKEKMLACFCHDFGKVLTAKTKDFNRIVFYGHGQAGVQSSLEFLLKFKEVYPEDIKEDQIGYILNLVSNHQEFYQIPIEKVNLLCNNDKVLLDYFLSLAKYDILGKIGTMDKFSSVLDHLKRNDDIRMRYEELPENNYDPNKKEIVFICGCSNIGKDSYAAKNGFSAVCSFDKERLNLFKKSFPDKGLDPIECYSEAFEFCRDKNHIIEENFHNSVINSLNENNRVAVCNTHTNYKNRKRQVSYFRNKLKNDVNINCIYLLSKREEIYKHRDSNAEKKIPLGVIDRFLDRQSIPSMYDGFDKVKIEIL